MLIMGQGMVMKNHDRCQSVSYANKVEAGLVVGKFRIAVGEWGQANEVPWLVISS